jgi:hypothetical protein
MLTHPTSALKQSDPPGGGFSFLLSVSPFDGGELKRGCNPEVRWFPIPILPPLSGSLPRGARELEEENWPCRQIASGILEALNELTLLKAVFSQPFQTLPSNNPFL